MFLGNNLFSQSFAPSDLPNLTLWLKADSGITQGTGGVSIWKDVSGHGYDAVQNTTGSQPDSVMPAELCGKPAIRFNSTTDVLTGPTISGIGNTSITLFIIAKPNPVTGNRSIFSIGNIGTNGFFLWHTAAVVQLRNNGAIAYNGNSSAQYYLFTAKKNFLVADTLFRNGVPGIPPSTATAFVDTATYNLGKASFSSFFGGEIAEIVLYKSALSPTDRGKVEKYLSDKYAPPPSLGNDTTIVFGFCPVTLKTGGICYSSYTWSTGATTPSINVNRTGSYWVRTTDIFGRQLYDTIKVTFPNVNINKSDTIICLGDTIAIAPQLSSFSNYTFTWSTGETSPSIAVSTSGDYYVTVNDGNCLAYSDTITITGDSFRNTVSLGPDTSMCAGNFIGIKAPINGWNALQFHWSTGSTDSLIAISGAGQYRVTVTNTRGCSGYDTTAVAITGSAPTIQFVGDTICLGETYFPSNTTAPIDTPIAYNWDFGNSSQSTAPNPNYIYPDTGKYMVSLTATTNAGCSSTSSRSVLIKPNPMASFQTTVACINNSYQFSDLSTSPVGTSINFRDWNFGDTTIHSFVQNPSHFYLYPNNHPVTLIVSATNGCTDTLQNILPVVATYTLPDSPVLQQPTDNYQLGSQNINFVWSPSQNAVRYALLVSGDSSFTTAIASNNISATQYAAFVPSNPVYYWKVRAYNICNDSSESVRRLFTMFNPSNLGNLALWLEADAGITQHGDTVSQWSDQSGNGYHATQSNINNQPKRVYPAELCGKPALKFDGIDDILNGTTIPNIDTGSLSLFLVGKTYTTSGNRTFFSIGTSTTGMWMWHGGPTFEFRNNASQITTPIVANSYYLLDAVKSLNTNAKLYKNGLLTSTGALPALTAPFVNGDYSLGKLQAAFSYLQGEIAEVILYKGTLSTSSRQQVENYLFNKYSAPVNLGPDITVNYGFCPVQLNATNCYKTYSWSTNETTPTVNVNHSGVYFVEVTDIFGRISRDTVVVKFPNINLTVSDTTICFGDTVHIQTQLTSINGYSFHWNTGDSSTSIQANTSGNYYVQVSGNGCSSFSDTLTVVIDTFQNTVSLGSDTSMCAGNLIGIKTPAIGWAGFQFQWSTGETNAYAIVPDSGNISVTVTNNIGCKGSDAIYITKIGSTPNVFFTGDTICLGQNYVPQNNSVSADTSHISGYTWEFGEGGIATDAYPSYPYLNVGNYTVTLSVATNVGCLNYAIHTVLVKPVPLAAFQAGTGCTSAPFQFIDISTAPQGDSINQWDWNFGDDSAHSLIKNPPHQYISSNTYPILFIATASNGCSDTIIDTLLVVQNAPNPQAIYLQSPANNFQVISPTVTFSWAATQNASDYSLLISTNSNFSSPLTIDNIVATQHTTTVSGGQTFYWKVRAYNICGVYSESSIRIFTLFTPTDLSNLTLWLAADVGVTQNGGLVSVWNDLTPNNFSATQPDTTKQPRLVNPIELVKPALRFGGVDDVLGGALIPGIGSSSVSLFVIVKPNVTTGNRSIFSVGAANGLFLWHSAGRYEFRNNSQTAYGPTITSEYSLITAKKKLGAFDSIYRNSVPINGVLSAAAGAAVPDTNYVLGKAPFSTFFNGEIAEVILYKNNLNNTERQQVENYLYNKYSPPVDLGPDKNQAYSLCPVPIEAGIRFKEFLWSTGDTTHSISVSKGGTYWVRATDVFDRVSSDTIQITLPYAGMNTPDTAVCIGSSINIVPILPEGSLYTFLWNDSISVNPFYPTDSFGNYFCSIADSAGCILVSDTVRITIDSFPLISLLPVDTGMCSGNNLAIETGIYHPRNQLWSTGDTTVQITISTNGIFSVDVTDINSCNVRDSVAVTIKGIAPTAYFTASRACFGDSVHFLDSSVTIQPDVVSFWNWSFGDNEGSVLKNPSHSYPITGDFVATLYIKTDSGCTGSYSAPIKVFAKPEAKYSYPGIICAGNSSQFFDNSIVLPTDTIIQWKWWFNQTDSFNSKSVAYSFPTQGNIPVIFRVTTTNGCSDAITSFIEVFPSLDANFNFSQTCLGDSTKFVDITPSLSIVRWQWNYGDGSFFASLQNPIHRYLVPGAYNVSLAVENAIGCVDTISKNLLVVEQPIADFTNLSHCIDLSYTPKDSSSSPSEPIHRWDWNIGGTLFNNNHYPQSYFADTGNYTVKLLVTTNSGCRDSVSKIVQVHPNPVSLFAMAPLYGEAPVNVTFNNHSTNATSYIWNFGDGSAVSSAENTTHTYSQNDTFHIVLTATSDFGCSNTSSQTFYVSHTDLDLSVDAVESVSQVQNDGSVLINVKALMSNVGTRTITHILAYATLGTGGVIAEDWTGLLQSGQIMEDTFHARFVVAASNANSYVCVEVVEVNHGETELRTDNNRQCESLTGTMQLVGPSPNPAFNQSTLGIVLPKAGKVSIAIVDALGHYVMPETELDFPVGRSDFEIPTGLMLAAEYFIRVTYNEEKTVRKFILQK